MSSTTTFRTVAAAICICSANVYGWLLAVTLVFKGTSGQVDIHPIIYLGVAVAAAMTLSGFAVAGNVREGIPNAVALLVLGAIAHPLTWAVSFCVQNGQWALVALLAIIPIGVLVAGGKVQRRLFPHLEAD